MFAKEITITSSVWKINV